MQFKRSISRSGAQGPFDPRRDVDRFWAAFRLCAITLLMALVLAPAMPCAQAQGLFGDGDAQRRQAESALQINQLQDQIRNLNGQIEQLGYQIRQMQDQMQKMQKDTDFRLQELENAPQPGRRTTPAPMKKSEVTPAPVAPANSVQPEADQASAPSPADTADAGVPTTLSPGADPVPPAGIGAQATQPRLGPGNQPVILGAPPQVLGQIPGSEDPLTGASTDGPIDLNQAQAPNRPTTASAVPGVTPKYANVRPTPSARDEYDAAYGYIMSGEYELAERSFKQFLSNHPTDRRSGSAQFWLGESYFQRNMHREATDAFLKSYTQYPDDVKAPDSLLKLGLAYQGLGERRAACNAYDELLSKYPKATKALRDRAQLEKSRGKCA